MTMPNETFFEQSIPLDDLAAFVRRFVVMTPAQAAVLACGSRTRTRSRPPTRRRTSRSRAPRSAAGKTRLLEVLELLVRAPLPTANIRDAALFRGRSTRRRRRRCCSTRSTRSSARRRASARTCAACSTPATAAAPSCTGWAARTRRTLETFPVFCPKAFAGIGDCLPDTIADRGDPDPAASGARARRPSSGSAAATSYAEGAGAARPARRLARAAGRRPRARCARSCRTSSTTARRTAGSRCSRSPSSPAGTGRAARSRRGARAVDRRGARGRLAHRAAARRHRHRVRGDRRRATSGPPT